MKKLRLSLIIGVLIFIGYSASHATNPISEKAYLEKDVEEKGKWRNSRFVKTAKRWYVAARKYVTAMTDRAKKFLFTWLGLGAASLVLFIMSYVVILAIPTEVGFILYFVFFLLSFLAAVASFVFFILWLVDYIQYNDAGTRAPGPETGEITPQEDKPERKRRKKKRN